MLFLLWKTSFVCDYHFDRFGCFVLPLPSVQQQQGWVLLLTPLCGAWFAGGESVVVEAIAEVRLPFTTLFLAAVAAASR